METVLILANDYTTIYNFRRELLTRLNECGYSVVLSIPDDQRNKVFEEMNCEVRNITLSRSGVNPFEDIKLIHAYKKLIREINPKIVFTYTAKPNIYGSIACRMLGVPCVNNITGLGRVFLTDGIVKKVMILLQRVAYQKSKVVFYQNEDNQSYFHSLGISKLNSKLLPGSGVNLTLHRYEDYPQKDTRTRFITISRIRADKGYTELFNIIRRVVSYRDDVEFHIVGLSEDNQYLQELKELTNNFPVVYHGFKTQEEVHELIRNAHCIVHPSLIEGMSNVILEGAAAGRPVIASNIPGCRESIRDNVTGLLFDISSLESFEQAINKFMSIDHSKRERMGVEARKFIEERFDRQFVVRAYLDEIESLDNLLSGV